MPAPAAPPRFASPEELVLQLKALPPSPRVVLRLQALAASETSSVDDLVDVIRIERALAARIVRIANGPLYHLGTRCDSIEQSVQRLGFREVRRVALLVSGSAALAQPLPAYAIDAQTLWHQSVACAIAAEHLARLTDEDGHLAYTAGLMHSVGMIVLNQWVQTVAPGTVLPFHGEATEWTQAEHSLLGYDLADAGAALLRHWDFPLSVVEAVHCQYVPQRATTARRLSAVLHAARWLRTTLCSRSLAGRSLASAKPALQLLGLSEQQLRDCVPDVLAEVNRARQVLGAS